MWSQSFGGSNGERSRAVAIDAAGNILVAGTFSGTANFGGASLNSAGSNDIFLAKYTPSGQHLWSKRLGGSGDDQIQGLTVNANGDILMTGNFSGSANFGGQNLSSAGSTDIFVAKYSNNGAHLWSKRFGGTGSELGYGVAVDSNDDVVITGAFSNTVDFGGDLLSSAGNTDIFVAKYTTQGNHLWSKRFGGSSYDYGRSVVVDGESGDVVVTGYFKKTADFGDETLISAGDADIFLMTLMP